MLRRRGKTSAECAVGAMRKRNSREWNTHHTGLWRDTGRDASLGLGADKLSTGKIHREENGEQNSGSFRQSWEDGRSCGSGSSFSLHGELAENGTKGCHES